MRAIAAARARLLLALTEPAPPRLSELRSPRDVRASRLSRFACAGAAGGGGGGGGGTAAAAAGMLMPTAQLQKVRNSNYQRW